MAGVELRPIRNQRLLAGILVGEHARKRNRRVIPVRFAGRGVRPVCVGNAVRQSRAGGVVAVHPAVVRSNGGGVVVQRPSGETLFVRERQAANVHLSTRQRRGSGGMPRSSCNAVGTGTVQSTSV